MEEKEIEMNGAAKSVNNFISKNLKVLTAICVVVIIGVVAWAVISSVTANGLKKDMEAVEALNYSLLKDSTIEGDELLAKQNEILEGLKAYQSKANAAGARANLLVADILFAQKKFAESKDVWLKAASYKAYTSPIAYFNAAVCCEETDDNDGALKYYEIASKAEDFFFANHAMFSIGRVYEAKGETEKAVDAYQKLFDKAPADSWAKLAMDRIIILKK